MADFNTAAGTSTQTFTMLDLEKLKASFQESRKRELQAASRMVEKMTCPVCGRKPIVTRDVAGDVTLVCPHTMAALKKRYPPSAVSSPQLRNPFAFDPIHGLRIQEFDDGPARW